MSKPRTLALLAALPAGLALLAAGGVLMGQSDSNRQPVSDDSLQGRRALRSHWSEAAPTSRPAGPRGRRRGRLTPEQEKEALEFLKQRRSERYEQLVKSRQDNPPRYRRSVRAIYEFMQRLKHIPSGLRETTLRQRDTEIRIIKRIHQIQKTEDPAKKEELKAELRKDVTEHFKAEQERLEQKLVQLAEQIERLRTELKERREQREQIVTERMEWWLNRPTPHPGPHSRRIRPARPKTQKAPR